MLKARSNAPFNGRNEAIGKIEEIAPAHLCEVVIVKGVTEVPVVIGVPAALAGDGMRDAPPPIVLSHPFRIFSSVAKKFLFR